jgi:hypothetical protein
MEEKEYVDLKTKAHAGDREAAETLARLWYQYSEDNAKALYWMQVASQNGSTKAEQFLKYAKPRMGEEAAVAPEVQATER